MNYQITIKDMLNTRKNLVQGLFKSHEKTCSEVIVYKFNGKELDSETNLYYYGARYYTAMENIWLSVDPLSDKYPSMSAYMYCAGNPVVLVDPDGMEPVLFGILQRTGEAKYGRSRLGESTTIGQYNVIPIYSSDNKTLIAYNAGRYLPNGEYRTEYQMDPGDLEGFAKNVSTYTAGANLVYCAGEPDWNLMMMTNYGMQGDYANALSSFGQSWANAFKDPGFWASVGVSFVGVSAAKTGTNLTLRPDVVLSGGRSGQLVKNLTGPANSVLKGNGSRIFITNNTGKVIWDITKDRAKSVIPGQGFGPKVAPNQQQLDLLNKIWGN